MFEQLKILLLCNKPKLENDANTIVDHIEAFEKYSKHKIFVCSNLGELPEFLDLSYFDVIVLHYSLYLPFESYLGTVSREKIKAFTGLKVAFVQDEYRRINDEIAILAYLKVDLLFTCFSETEADKIYDIQKLPDLKKINTLTGYVPARLLNHYPLPKIKDRIIDVGYRARKLGYFLGELAFEKWDIVEKWKKFTAQECIKNDVSHDEKDRIYGEAWINFIKNCKVQLGVESGASVMDFTGDLEKKIVRHLELNPFDDFYKVQSLYLKDYEGRYKLNQISPRCFESIALKTVLVLYEGEYSNILIPDRHYISLKKDFSNIADVLRKIKDDDYLQSMADLAYDEIALNPKYSYQTFIKNFDDSIFQEFNIRHKLKSSFSYSHTEFDHLITQVSFKTKLIRQTFRVKNKVKRMFIQVLM